MNQTFNLQRFLLVLKLEFTEKGKNYLMMAGVLTALLLLLMLPIIMWSQHDEIFIVMHAFALFLAVIFGGSLYTNQIFSQYGDPATGISAIMVPASRFEKFMVALLINLMFIIPFWLFFSYLHYATIDYANNLTKGDNQYEYLPKDIILFLFFLHCVIQGSIILGSIYFSKKSYIKTAIYFFAIVLLISMVSIWQAYHLTSYPSKIVAFPFSSWKIWYYEKDKMFKINFPDTFQQFVYAFPVLLMVGLWVAAFLRLREKQI